MPTPYNHNECPICNSDDLQAGEIEIPEGTSTYQPVTCNSCGSKWNDVYKLQGYSDLVKGE